MKPIYNIEHPNTKGVVTSFIGKQVDICGAFEFYILDGYKPEYVIRKAAKGMCGYSRKNKLAVKD